MRPVPSLRTRLPASFHLAAPAVATGKALATAIAVAAAVAVAAALVGCNRSGEVAEYRFAGGDSTGPGFPLRYEAVLEGRVEGLAGARPYDSRARARLRFQAVTDSAAGRIEAAFSADSIGFSASDRDAAETGYMEDRLRRYKARMVLSSTGRVLALEEEPEPPPVDFSPLNIGRFLAFGMPAFPSDPVKEGSEWLVEQPLLDKFHPASRVVKRYRVAEVRETAEGRLLLCSVNVEAWLDTDLGAAGYGSSGDTSRPALSGKGEAVFDLARGVPVSSRLEMEGRFVSQVRENGSDSGRVVDRPIRLALRLDLQFGP